MTAAGKLFSSGCALFVGLIYALLTGTAGCAVPAGGGGGGGGAGGQGQPVICQPLSDDIDTSTTLNSGCYMVQSDISVSDGATLTIKPGVTLKFQQDTGMTVWSDGRLSAVGTVDEPIVLTGEEDIRGYWDGLRFYQSNSTENRLEHVTIENGGGYWDANLYIEGTSSSPSRVAIANCTLRESGTYGFYFDGNSIVGQFTGNTVTSNTLGAGTVAGSVAGYLDDTSTYAGNDQDTVLVQGDTVSTDQTWPGIDADYLIDGSIGVSAALTIEPGARLVFRQGNEMTVWSDGQLSAVGTASQPVVLTGEEPTRGYWGGLRFYQSNSIANRLDHVTIEYGGGYWDANVSVDGTSSSPSRVSITNCTLRGSENYGFEFTANAIVDDFTDNTITANTLGAGDVAGNVTGYLDDTSTYTGNDADVVLVEGDTVSTDQSWPAIDADYLVDGSIGVSAALTIEPGARLVFKQSQQMTVWEDGRLSAVGTADQPIVFTGEEATPGYWGGLRFYQSNSAENRLEQVTIEYGGGYWDANLSIDGTSTSPARIVATGCTIRQSGTWGIWIHRDATVNADIQTANSFSGNTDGDIFREP